MRLGPWPGTPTSARRRPWLLRLAAAAGVAVALLFGAAVWFEPELLITPNPEQRDPPDVPGARIEVVRLRTPDGETLVGWFLAPQPGRPVMLFYDGKYGSLWDQRFRWRRYAKAGVGAFSLAYRGFSGSTGRPSEAGLHADAETAWRWLAARCPADRIIIHGVSLGSGVAVRIAAEHPARALILEAPFTSAADAAQSHLPWLPIAPLVRDRFDNRPWIGKVAMPVLVIHGDRDSVVPFAEVQALFRLANAPKTFVRFPGSDHVTLVRDGAYGVIWKWLGVPDSGALSK
jgi:fermentation-respiration switch protein FrsA (DUF1100 family)